MVVSQDGLYAYVSGWTTRSIHQYDLTAKKEVAKSAFTFMPDNLTWTAGGKLLAAGIKGVDGNCPADSQNPCLQGFGVAEVEPGSLAVSEIYDNDGKALINGVSVAKMTGARSLLTLKLSLAYMCGVMVYSPTVATRKV